MPQLPDSIELHDCRLAAIERQGHAALVKLRPAYDFENVVKLVNRHGPTTAGGGYAEYVGGPVIFTLGVIAHPLLLQMK